MSKKDTHTLGEPLVSIAARFPASLAAQIDGHLEAMRRTVPGVTIGRSDALRSLVMHALGALYSPTVNAVTDTVTDTHVTDTSQIRLMLQQELRAFLGDIHLSQGIAPTQPVTDTVTDVYVQAEAVRAATEIPYVTDTGTDTVDDIQDHPVPEAAMDHQGEYVTDAVTDTHVQSQDVTAAALETPLVTDTVTDTPARAEDVTEPPAPRKPPRRRKRLPVTY